MAGMLKIIAERAGLSQSTVSQILNRKANDFSSEETRQRVFALASELGYKQNFGHKLLRGDKTRTVGVLLGMHRITLEEQRSATARRKISRLSGILSAAAWTVSSQSAIPSAAENWSRKS